MPSFKKQNLNFKLPALIAALLLLSCNGNKIYREIDEFDSNRWAKTDVRSFSFEVPTAGKYDFAVIFSHVYDTPLANIPIIITMENPDGKSETQHIIMHIRNEDGKQLGDCSGDYCDFEQEIFKDRTLAGGSYKVTLSNDFDYDYMPNVIGVGIEISKSKSK